MDLNNVDRCLGCMQDKAGAAVCPHCGWDEARAEMPPLCLPRGIELNGQYVLGRRLGHGGFGITYLAWDLRLDTRVAIKEYLPREHATRAADGITVVPFPGEGEAFFAYGRNKFIDEARMLARFAEHPGIVKVLGFFEANGTAYMVMQYVDGVDLKTYIGQVGGRLPPAMALGILAPVLDALRAVHGGDLLHRDLSPDNVYVARSGRIILLDFGAARDAMGSHSRSLALIRKSGFSPEEQYRVSGRQGPWTDVYSAAATLYCMLTGQAPPDAMDRLAEDDLKPPSQLGVPLTPQQEAALMKALAVRAEQRFQDVRAFETALTATALAAAPVPMTAVTPPPVLPTAAGAGYPRWLVPVLGMTVAMLGGGLVVALVLPAMRGPHAPMPVTPAYVPTPAPPIVQTPRPPDVTPAPSAPPPQGQVPGTGPEVPPGTGQGPVPWQATPRDAGLAEAARLAAEQRARDEAGRHAREEAERRADEERRRQEQARQQAEEARARQAQQEAEAVAQAKQAALDTVRAYYGAMAANDLAGTANLRLEIKNRPVFEDGVRNCAEATILNLGPEVQLALDGGILFARIPVRVRVRSVSKSAETWAGDFLLELVGGAWKIRKLDLGRAD